MNKGITTDIKKKKRGYYKKKVTYRFDNTDDNQLFKNTSHNNFPKMEIENFNNPNIIKEIGAISKFPHKEISTQFGKFYQTFEEDLIPVLHYLL